MKMPDRNTLLAWTGLFVAGAFLLGVLSFIPNITGSSAPNADDPASFKKYLVKEIGRVGAPAVYASFKADNEKLAFPRQHLQTHIMGEALYDALGPEGVTACDSSFGFGCFHGFFGRAIAEGGEKRIAELDSVCVNAFGPLGTGCQHGLGHGILEYTGYERLNDALALCKETTQLVPLLGCTSGVFMEYNTPLVGAGDGLQPETRKFDEEDPYTPCPSVPQENRASCYYELGGWLLIALNSDYEKAGATCAGLSGDNRKYCFLGAGSLTAVFNHYSVEQSIAVCARFAADDELSCRAGASWSLFANPEYRAGAPALCAYTSEVRTKECLALSDLTEGREPSHPSLSP